MPQDDRDSADPLAALGRDSPAVPAIADLWMRWLSAELLEDQDARLEQAGTTPDTGIALARIFIDVAASSSGSSSDEPDQDEGQADAPSSPSTAVPPAPGLLSALLSAAPRPRAERGAPGAEAEAATPDDAPRRRVPFPRLRHRPREQSTRLLVIGGPGQGKSTLVQYLCQIHRAELLRARVDRLLTRERQALELVTERARAAGLPRVGAPCLPLRIILRDFAAWMFREEVDPAEALIRFIAARMGRTTKTVIEPEVVRAALSRLPWLLVLDGLDEVPSSAGRAEVLSAVRALLDGPLSRTPHLVIATTRPQGYGGELGDFEVRTLLGLSRARALAYAACLVEARYPGQSARPEEIFERLASAWKEPASRRLMRTPLQVSIMAALVAQVGRAPADRWRLFSDYYRVMYQREAERPNLVQAELIRSLRRQIDEIHRLAGLWLQTRSERAGETDALLSEDELARLIDGVLERGGHDDADERRSLVRQIFEAAVERLVFLTHAQDGKYGFEIRSLQELMAAEALLTGGDAEVTQRLRHIAPLDAWRNVLLFAAGKCFAETWHLAPVIVHEICPWLNDGHEDPAVRASLTGSEVALDLIADGAARNQPKLARSLATLALRALELPPLAIHVWLVAVGILELEAPLRQALEARLDLPEPGHRLSAWAMLVALADAEVPWAQEAANRRWPSDGPARRDIVEAANRAEVAAGRWLQARMAEALGDFPPAFVRTVRFDAGPEMPLAWLAAARPDDEGPMLGCEVPLLLEGKPTRVKLFLFSEYESAWHLSPFGSMHNPPAAWLPLVVAAHLAGAPSATTLAEGLRRLAASYEPEAWAALRWELPWPLEQALATARDADALRRLASAAEAGACGDQAEWAEARQEWEQGVSLEALLSIESDWPGKNRKSFPVAAAWSSWPSNVPWNRDLLDRAVAEYRKASPTRRALLAHVLSRFIFDLWYVGREAPGALLPEEIRDVWVRTGYPPEPQAIAALMPASPEVGPWIILMDDVGNTRRPERFFWMNSLVLFFVNWHARSPGSLGLLRLIAIHLTAMGLRRSEVPAEAHAIDPARFPVGSPARFHAALICLLAEPDEPESTALLTAIVDSLPSDPKEASLAVGYFRRPIFDESPASPARVSELLAQLPGYGWRLGSTAVEALQDHRKRRMSSLDDPLAWARLGLPLPAPAKRVSSRPPPRLLHAQIDAIHIDGLRAFGAVDLPIPAPPENRTSGRWITLLGENGTGKTTILRSIALALTDPSLADTILKASPAPYLAHDAQQGLVRVEASGIPFSARLSRGAATEELEGDADRERPLLFAYGCRRGSALGGAARAVSFKPYESIATLFEEGAGLIHAETWLKERALAAKEKDAAAAKVLFEAIRQALVRILPGVRRVDVKAEGVWIEGPAVGRTMLGGLSDGYVSTMGWILDLIARWVDHKERTKEPVGPDLFEEMEGIVLVDEIDLYLHPSWQVRVIDDIRALFPRMTFVVTTHNPLTLLGARPGEVIVLRRSEIAPEGEHGSPTHVEAVQQDIPPGLTVDQVLTGAWFGLASTLDKDTLKLLEQHRGMLRAGVGREDPKRVALEAELRQRLGGFADTSLERLAQSVAAELLPEQTPEQPYKMGSERRERLRRRVLETVAAEAAPQPAQAAAQPKERR